MIEKTNMEEKEIIIKKESLPVAIDLEGMAGQGNEFVTARDTKLPILKMLYASSPVLNDRDPRFDEKASLGDIWSETSGRVWKGKEGFFCAPCLYINTFNEWKDKGLSTGRPVKIHIDPAIMSETKRDMDGKDRLPNGNYVEDTGNHFVCILDEKYNVVEQALLTMKSTQKKKSKMWNSMIGSRRAQGKNGFYNPPRFSQVYKVSTTKEAKGDYTWSGWVIEFISLMTPDKNLKTLEATQGFYKSAMTSDIFGKVDFSQENQSQGNDQSKESAPF
tara:strand:+ start:12128 stop:12952 length:825 start_codon:yes stop_codon:yes gene_type:complete